MKERKEKFVKTRVSDAEVEQFIKIAKDCGVSKSAIIVGIFKTLSKELIKINNSEKRNNIKEELKEKFKKNKKEKGYLSFTDLFASISSTVKDGCDNIANDMNQATRNEAIDLKNNDSKKDNNIGVDNKVKS